MANYLITGAAGFIGAALAERFVDDGHNVVTIDNLSTGFESNVPSGVLLIRGDCADSSIYRQLPEIRFDAIYHIAGQSSGEMSFDDPIYDIRTNAESTLLLLKYALRNRCNRFIYASTMSVYGIKPDRQIDEGDDCHPQSFYGVAKLASEHYLRIYQQYGINTTSLRLFNVYGPGQNLSNLRQGMVSIFLAQMLNTGHIHVKGAPDRFRDFIYIDDVTEAFVKCLAHEDSWGKEINIGTGVKTRVDELINALLATVKSTVTVEYSGNTAGDIHGIYANTTKMKTLLGMNDLTTIEKGIEYMVEWARKS